MNYNQRLASDQYARTVDGRLKVACNLGRDVLAWKKRFGDLNSKLSAKVDGETQTRQRNNELAVRLDGENTRHPQITDARDLVVTFGSDLSRGVEDSVVKSIPVMDKLRANRTTLAPTGPRDANQNLFTIPWGATSLRLWKPPLHLVKCTFSPVRSP